MTQTTLTHAALASDLGCSRSYVSRLSRLGMPTDSVQNARSWIKKRSEETGVESPSRGLTAAREEKIRLEIEILALRLERERDDVELVRITELERFIDYFITYMVTACNLQAEQTTNEIVGKSEREIFSLLRQMCDQSIFLAGLGYCKTALNGPDPRLIAYAEQVVRKQFAAYPTEINDGLEKATPSLIRLAKEKV